MNAPTKECPHCKKQISVFGLIYVRHVETCKAKQAVQRKGSRNK